MKPISIEMKGFSSFKKKTIVNFEPLTQTAIWGIFGKTGSGKSSILDGIFLSLYNKIIRNKLIKEVINLSSKESEVVFNFSVLEYNEVRKFYRIQRNHKIDKDGNLTQTAKMWQVLTDGEEILLANGEEFVTNKAIEIIGLTEEGFRRTVTLHQGEYHQFLKSSPAYQAKIISDLFGLSQYGEKLLTNTVIYKSELEKEESFQRGRLSEYEALTLADIIATKKQATDTAHAAKIKQAEHEIMRVEVLRKEKELIVREEMNEALEARAKMDKSRKDYAKAKKELTTLKVAKKCIPSIERLDIERFTLRENETKLKETDKRLLEVLEKATMLGVKKEQEKTTKMLEIAEKEARKELLLRAVSAEDSILALDKKRKRLEEKKEAQIAKVKKLESVYTINDDEQQKGNEALLKIREAQEKLRVPETILADAKEFDKLSNEISLYAGRGQFLEERLQVVNGKHSTILEKLVADDEKLVVIESEVNNLEERLKEVSGKEAFEESIISANKDHYGLVMGAQNIMFEKARQKEIAKGAAEVETMLRELTEKEKGLTRKFEDYNAAYNNLSERRDKLIEEIFVKARTAGGEASEAVFEVENINARVIELLNLRDKTLAELSGAKISKEHYKLEKTRLTNELIASEKVVSAIEAEHNLLINKDEAQILEVIEASTTFNNELSSIVKTLFRLKEKKLEKEKQCIKNSAELNQIDSQKDFVSTEIEFNQEILKELNKKNEKFAVLFDSVDLKDLISDIETKRRLEEEAKRKEAEIMQILNAVNKEREKSFVAFELAGVDLRHIENQIEVVVDEIKEQRQIVNFSGTRENARTELMEVINTLDALKISVDRINEEDALLIKEETRLKLEKSALIGDITLRRKAVERLDQEIRALLQNAGVKKEDVVNSTDFEDIEKLEEVVLQFERNYREISERIDRLNKLSPNNKTTVTEFKKIKEEVEAVQKEYIELVKKEEWLKHKAVEQEATLKKVEAYREEYRNVKEKLDETVKLFELIKSGEFLRFVVREYMVNITKRANSHLATLTSGRYQLAFDNDEFQVADNLYGSSRRSITTLSGGETFLASLALAVAVVESLTQFRPQKLEFMFLDEGFGTLDDESLVTVMNAFRNLKGDDFTIGIISHEDAVKNAVQNKIEVVKVHTADGAISLIE